MFGQDHMTSSRIYRDLLKRSLCPYRIHSALHLGLSYECSPLNMLQDLKTKAVEFLLRESWLAKRKNHLQAITCWSNPYPWNLLTKVWDNGPSCSTLRGEDSLAPAGFHFQASPHGHANWCAQSHAEAMKTAQQNWRGNSEDQALSNFCQVTPNGIGCCSWRGFIGPLQVGKLQVRISLWESRRAHFISDQTICSPLSSGPGLICRINRDQMTESWASTQKQEVSFPTNEHLLQQCRNLPHFFTRIQGTTVPF